MASNFVLGRLIAAYFPVSSAISLYHLWTWQCSKPTTINLASWPELNPTWCHAVIVGQSSGPSRRDPTRYRNINLGPEGNFPLLQYPPRPTVRAIPATTSYGNLLPRLEHFVTLLRLHFRLCGSPTHPHRRRLSPSASSGEGIPAQSFFYFFF